MTHPLPNSTHPDVTAPPADRHAVLPDLLCPAGLAALFAERAAASWRKWPDAVTDFGRELYIPWRLADGAVLYRDVTHTAGPLSACLNAVGFRLFGPSLTTLAVANLFLLAVFTAGVYYVLRRAFDRTTATAAGAVFLGVYAFGHYTACGNYNFVCPYAHELTHGVYLTAAMLVAWVAYARGAGAWAAAAAGACLGLLFLGKPETCVAAAAALATGVLILPGGRRWRGAAWVLPGFLTPLAACYAGFAVAGGADVAGEAVFAAWRPLFHGGAGLPFYRRLMGLDDPAASLAALAVGCARAAALVGAAWAAGRAFDRPGPPRLPSLLLAAALAVAGYGLKGDDTGLLVAGPVFPGAVLAAGVGAGVAAWRRPGERAWAVPLALAAVWAAALMGKVLLRPKVDHYGFALTPPAALVLVAGLVGVAPRFLGLGGRGRTAFRVVVCAALLHDVTAWRAAADHFYRLKTVPIGRGADRMYGYPARYDWRAETTNNLLRWLDATAPGEDLVVLPDSAMLNYLARRPSPVPYAEYMPIEMSYYGEERILDRLRGRPPGVVVILTADFTGLGVPQFGEPGNGGRIMDWLREHYAPAHVESGVPQPGAAPAPVAVVLRRKNP